MARHSQTDSGGFTLIELLVVIAIIGILSAVVLASLSTARDKSRDAHRLEAAHQLQLALETYRTSNATYPSTSGTWWATCATFGSHTSTGASGWIPNLAPTYISVLPDDPKPQANGCGYLYNSNGTDYMLLVYGTVESYTQATNKWLRPLYQTEKDFAFYTEGASGW